jgi:hypothetical protein
MMIVDFPEIIIPHCRKLWLVKQYHITHRWT